MTEENSLVVQPSKLLEIAINNNAELDKLEKLMELQTQYEKKEAEKAYNKAMAKFKADPPEIIKSKKVQFKSTKYNHADLGEAVTLINKKLSEYGLFASWDIEQEERVKVTCIIKHELGHSEQTSFKASPDTSGSKNNIQSLGSTVTYLQRYSLFAITGLIPVDLDDDGASAEAKDDPISEEQIANITALCEEVDANMKDFYNFFEIKEIAELPSEKYSQAILLLEKKRSKK